MFFAKFAAAASFAAGVAASTIPEFAFQIVILRTLSTFNLARVSASQSGLWLHVDAQNASCHTLSDGHAIFRIVDDELLLYSTENPPQRVYVQRSGMNQGKVGYTTGAESPPRNAETAGWIVSDAGQLTFDGTSFLACPTTIGGPLSIWADTGMTNPGANIGCLGLVARIVESKTPNSCLYTS